MPARSWGVSPSTPASLDVPPVHIRLLGGFGVERAGQEIVHWPRRNARALIKLLAATPSHRLHAEQVQEALFPDAAPQAAHRQVYRVLYAARQVLEPERGAEGWSPYLRIEDEILSLHPALVQIDADAFEGAAREAMRSTDPAVHQAALDLYTGELLPDDRYAEWTEPRRQELADLALQLMLRSARLFEERRNLAPALEWTKRALERDPWHEESHRQLMRLYALAGRRQEAIRHYQEWTATAQAELGTEPDPQTATLFHDIVAGAIRPIASESAATEGEPALPRAAVRGSGSTLVGRERALQLLGETLEGTAAGAGALLLISGEAGVGKTRLVAELARRARDRGCVVLWGTSYAGESLLPYGPYLAALDEYAGRLPEATREQFSLRFPELAAYVPALVSHSTPAPEARRTSGAIAPAIRLVGVIPRILGEISSTRPLVLILDDLHAADDDTIQLLRHLTRLAGDRPWLLVGTYREGEIAPDGTLSNLMRLAVRRQLGRHLEVLRLARDESDALVGTLLGGGRVESETLTQLYEATLGNPLFLRELVHALRDDGQLTFAGGAWRKAGDRDVPVPEGVRELVAVRVDGLEQETRAVVQLAAVAGMTCPYPLLQAGSSFPEERLTQALEEALSGRMLDEADDGYRFTHPLIRLAIYERLSRTRRAQLHRRLGESYERLRPGEVEALAHHWGQTQDAEKAVHYAELAGDRAQQAFANGVAATYFRQALHHLLRTASGKKSSASAIVGAAKHSIDETLARLSEKLGTVLFLSGHSEAAIEVLEEAARLYRSLGDVRGEARAVAQLGQAHFQIGTVDEGLARLGPVIERVEAHGDERSRAYPLAMLYTSYARLLFGAGRYREQLRVAEAAQQLATQIGDRHLAAQAGSWRGVALMQPGRREEAKAVMLAAAREAEELGDLVLLANILANVAGAYEDDGELQTAYRHEERSAELAERAGAPVQVAWTVGTIGSFHSQLGDWEQAKECFRRQGAILQDLDAARYAAYATSALGYHLLLQGDESGRRMIEEGLEVAQRGRDRQGMSFMQRHLAFYDLEEGRPEDAIARLEPLRNVRPDEIDQAGFIALVWMARAALALGRLEQGQELLDEAMPAHDSGRLDDRAVFWSTRAKLLAAISSQQSAISNQQVAPRFIAGVSHQPLTRSPGSQCPPGLQPDRCAEPQSADNAESGCSAGLQPASAASLQPAQGAGPQCPPDVQSALDEALTLVCARENRWAEALVRRDAGELLLAYGDLQAAREHLEIAAAFFRRAGAKPLLAKTEKLLVAVSDQQSAISFDP